MARATDPHIEAFEKFARGKPEITALSDLPLESAAAHGDRFDFRFQIGGIYDILRHPSTKTPLSIAIYGNWGTGKTSAMRWLAGLIEEWNKRKNRGGPRLFPVWFYPWKYHTKEDVWRGIISEVILATIQARNASPKRLLDAAERFGGFLGRSFVNAIASISLKVKDPSGTAEASVSLSSIQRILKDFGEVNRPDRAFLNEFERTLNEWIGGTIGNEEKERMVVFIDDLDRCLPSVTIEVLEALKLYLNIPNLVFVVGLDREVVHQVLVKEYADRGVDKEKSLEYLAKMFQVEVNLFRMQSKVDEYMAELLTVKDSLWVAVIEEDHHGDVFMENIRLHAGDTPREIKRVINAATIDAIGWTRFEMQDEAALTFTESLQRHFLRRRLENPPKEFLPRPDVMRTSEGNSFLGAWSQVFVDTPDAPFRIPPSSLAGQEGPEALEEARLRDRLQEVPLAYAAIAEDQRFSNYRRLLEDEVLGRLLSVVPFRSSEAIVQREENVSAEPETDSANILDAAVRRELGLEEYATIKSDQYEQIDEIDLSDTLFSEENLLQRLTNLMTLILMRTKVTDVTSLARLSNLEFLDLDGTTLSNVAPLASLSNLTNLYLTDTQARDLAPLASLTKLGHLHLGRTQVSDLAPLAGLTNLEHLVLNATQVSDLAPLASLTNLAHIHLDAAQVSDVTPLAGLTNLIYLNLDATQVSDVTPLAGLTNLRHLDLNATQVSDVAPLGALLGLRSLDIRKTKVPYEAVVDLQATLPDCKILYE